MPQGGSGDDSLVSDETRMLAAQVRSRAATAPDEAAIKSLAAQALSEPRDAMSEEQIRALAARAVDQAQQLSSLLTRLASLLGDGGRGDGRE